MNLRAFYALRGFCFIFLDTLVLRLNLIFSSPNDFFYTQIKVFVAHKLLYIIITIRYNPSNARSQCKTQQRMRWMTHETCLNLHTLQHAPLHILCIEILILKSPMRSLKIVVL